jgi:hypothetical protein
LHKIGAKLVKMTKRPFGYTYELQGAIYRVTMTSTKYSYELVTEPKVPAKEEIVSGGYTRTQLSSAFDLVKDPKDWKNKINAVVAPDADTDCITQAVIFFTGSVPSIVKTKNGFNVRAAGYYMSIGS